MHKARQRRPLKPNEVRYEYNGVVACIYRRKGPDWQEYCQLRVARYEAQHAEEDVASRHQWPGLMQLVDKARLEMPKWVPSSTAIAVYLAHTSWGWELARIARMWEVHRTLPGRYVKRVEDARDDDAFDVAISDLECQLK